MRAKPLFFKALYALDHGLDADGERLLRETLQLAQAENDSYTTASALVSLGELTLQSGRRNEAELFLRRFQFIKRPDDALNPEARRVAELLDVLKGNGTH